ncbi:MAG: alpha-L-rhamnosidase [Ktedonobacteraceae bacterium]|nr:alpha-L-rhamnosidase [Ktedonobacteraceae bacterium]
MKRAFLFALILNLCLCSGALLAQSHSNTSLVHAAAASTPGDAYNYSPTTRTLAPTAIYTTSGTVSNPTNLLAGQSTRLSGKNAYVAIDFGKEVGGIVTLTFAGSSDSSQSIGLAFSESSNNVGTNSDASSGGGADGAIYAAVAGAGAYTMPGDKLRGGFRYLTLFLNSSGWVDINGVSLNFTAEPAMSNPAAYPNYFYSNDSLLNKIWYAGAYTVQLDTINPTQGRVWPAPSSGWENNGTVGVGSEVLTDGAKRDRSVWPGDMGVSLPSEYVSTDDLVATRNSLTTIYQHQNTSTGELPYSGPEFNLTGSDTYHMWTLIGTSTYYLYSADKSWLDGIWSQYQSGVNYSTGKIDGNGLMNVTGTNDWARNGQGGENIEANALLYEVLTTGATLAQVEGNSSLANTYSSKATNLKTQINTLLWDASAGSYKDNPGSTLHPQDGNSLAVWYNVVSTAAQAQSIINTLHNNWNNLGAVTPEWNNNISPFAGSMELFAHFAANDDGSAIALMKREWGYMLNASIGTGSTFWEGYTASGAFGYGSSFTSLAHGWSTGPTSALTQYVLGISPTTTAGQSYQVIPHAGNLTHVEGTLTVASGKALHVSYDHPTSGNFTMQVDSSTNSSSTGVIAVPRFGQSHVVTINGVTAWNSSSFVGASGIGSADQDTNYIYFRGVQPGSYTFSYPATNTIYQSLPGTWTQCAVENATCTFSGTMTVAFGANGSYNYATKTNGTACSNAVFGDPLYQTAKACYIEAVPPATNVWAQCAAENTTCSFLGTMTVAFGANGSYNYATETNGTACTTGAFGDPLYGTVKACYLVTPPDAAATWSSCAAENSTCSFTGRREVAYGANGKYFYGSFTNGTPCNNSVFGDPVSGVVKACYYQ